MFSGVCVKILGQAQVFRNFGPTGGIVGQEMYVDEQFYVHGSRKSIRDSILHVHTSVNWSSCRYPQMPIGKVWIDRLLFVCNFVCV